MNNRSTGYVPPSTRQQRVDQALATARGPKPTLENISLLDDELRILGDEITRLRPPADLGQGYRDALAAQVIKEGRRAFGPGSTDSAATLREMPVAHLKGLLATYRQTAIARKAPKSTLRPVATT